MIIRHCFTSSSAQPQLVAGRWPSHVQILPFISLNKPRTRPWIVVAGVLICAGLIYFRSSVRMAVHTTAAVVRGPSPGARTVDDRVREYGETVRRRIEPDFQRQNVPYPPARLTFVILKQEKTLEVQAAGKDGKFRLIRAYPILAASGYAGPKLREGDGQVPEGLYRIESLNPNSLFHLSLRINYPNEFDRAQAATEGRENLGGDIMIHGSSVSVGCLAMGDPAAEDLFVLAALTGVQNIQVVLSPQDFRLRPAFSIAPTSSGWLRGLYETIAAELQRYPKPDHA